MSIYSLHLGYTHAKCYLKYVHLVMSSYNLVEGCSSMKVLYITNKCYLIFSHLVMSSYNLVEGSSSMNNGFFMIPINVNQLYSTDHYTATWYQFGIQFLTKNFRCEYFFVENKFHFFLGCIL